MSQRPGLCYTKSWETSMPCSNPQTSIALRRAESSRARDGACVPGAGSWSLYHQATREVTNNC